MNNLNKIKLIKQPENTTWCGAACIAMVLNYYGIYKFTKLQKIWKNIRKIDTNSKREICKTYKMGKFLLENKIHASIVRFKDLKLLLDYCLKQNIPLIMNHSSFKNPSLGHFTVFIDFRNNSIALRDPENEDVSSVDFEKLRDSFQKKNSSNEIGGNIVILTKKEEKIDLDRDYIICKYCREEIDISPLVKLTNPEAVIRSIICPYCDKAN